MLAIQQIAGNRAATILLQRRFLGQPGAAPTSYGFQVGREISADLAADAMTHTTSGHLTRMGLQTVARAEQARTGTLGESSRLFLVGLLKSTNVAIFRTGMASTPQAFMFPLATISASSVAALEAHPSLIPRSVLSGERNAERLRLGGRTNEASAALLRADQEAAAALRRAVSGREAEIDEIIADAHSRGIPARSVLRAMQNAAVDPNPDDRLAAGLTYTVAAAAGMAVASDVEQGHIRVDAVEVSQLSARGSAAEYSYAAGAYGGLDHGNTLYLSRNLRIGNLAARGAVIHELTHALQDKRGAGSSTYNWLQAEGEAYLTQARYLLGEVAFRHGQDQQNTALQVSNFVSPTLVAALVLVTAEDRSADRALNRALILVRSLSPRPELHQDATQVRQTLARPIPDLRREFEAAVRQVVQNAGQDPARGPLVRGFGDRSITGEATGFRP